MCATNSNDSNTYMETGNVNSDAKGVTRLSHYVFVNSDAKAYQNKAIENWDDIYVLVGTDKATGEDAKQIDDSIAAMDMEGDLRPRKARPLEPGRESYNKKYKAKVYKN
ncbi:uncharacterized protein A4U43_C05F32040 [Asparagus officinalis]|uniref:Uncharacterized protein n=1 Tax=Asparagus officinalis TaxID=4686 RepID=A0A5P1EWP9_ASPOF|nr:uncharacterized protein A4U43_C05F32040 [Asparagus officinalis]